jgi:hypothetical protein
MAIQKTAPVSKKKAVSIYGSQYQLAIALGITRQAISKWPDDKPIPDLQAMRLRYELAPEHFKKNSNRA